jgi:dTDP-4-dehydrorhamnose 3,5-epimerase
MSFNKYVTKYSPITFDDNRGYLKVISEDNDLGVSYKESFSKKGVFRGMHIQNPPYKQVKHIKVLSGSIIDYVIVLDKKSDDFGKTFSTKISASNDTYCIPSFCAHGFKAIEDTVLRYICIGKYSEDHEVCIKQKPDKISDLIVSKKDENGIPLDECLEFFYKIRWE